MSTEFLSSFQVNLPNEPLCSHSRSTKLLTGCLSRSIIHTRAQQLIPLIVYLPGCFFVAVVFFFLFKLLQFSKFLLWWCGVAFLLWSLTINNYIRVCDDYSWIILPEHIRSRSLGLSQPFLLLHTFYRNSGNFSVKKNRGKSKNHSHKGWWQWIVSWGCSSNLAQMKPTQRLLRELSGALFVSPTQNCTSTLHSISIYMCNFLCLKNKNYCFFIGEKSENWSSTPNETQIRALKV